MAAFPEGWPGISSGGISRGAASRFLIHPSSLISLTLNYEVDIRRLAKDTGQRAPTPPAAVKKVAESSDSEEEDTDDKSRPKKNLNKVSLKHISFGQSILNETEEKCCFRILRYFGSLH